MGAAAAGGEEDEALELAAAGRARFLGGIVGDVWGGNQGTNSAACASRALRPIRCISPAHMLPLPKDTSRLTRHRFIKMEPPK